MILADIGEPILSTKKDEGENQIFTELLFVKWIAFLLFIQRKRLGHSSSLCLITFLLSKFVAME